MKPIFPARLTGGHTEEKGCQYPCDDMMMMLTMRMRMIELNEMERDATGGGTSTQAIEYHPCV